MADYAPKDFTAGSSSLVAGADSYTTPTEVADNEFVMGQNVVCRGGILQNRPGTRTMYCMPDGNLQGFKVFTPNGGVAHHVFAVDGKVYTSPAPFTSYTRLWNIQFSPTAKYVTWAVCLKSNDYDNSGVLFPLDNPYSVLVMQDGFSRAAYWDGGKSGHLNPALPPFPDQSDVVPGYDETPIGLWSIWSGNRLWVSRENQVFASDIGNPLKFTEALYLNEGRSFYLSGPCTGMIETADRKGIIAFTENDGTLFQSSIQDRPTWLDTDDFQNVIIPNVGCVAPRSVVTQYGLTWWFGPRGLTNINAALRTNISSRVDYQDNEMFSSKSYLGPDLSGICGSYYENYLMISVPSADIYNRHTWALDQDPFNNNAAAWAGIWTGWRPVEWSRGLVNGDERIFFASIDYDGKNRVWEAMLAERTDNGCRMTCYAQLRDHAAGDLTRKRYAWSKFFLSQILGEVDLNVYVASTKGGFQLQKGYHLVASEGQIFSDTEYSEEGPLMVGNRVQSRTIRTPSDPVDDECNACGVESSEGNMIDYAFSHLLVWSGQMGIRAYQMHMREEPEREDGDCEETEVGPRTLNSAGCSGMDLLVDGDPFPTFEGNADGVTNTANGGTAYIRRKSVSLISQQDAETNAACNVEKIIAQMLEASPKPGVYSTTEPEIGNETFIVVDAPITHNVIPPPPDTIAMDYLVVGGGGGTGFSYSGGGGAGQLRQGTAHVDPTQTYPVIVGVGGPGGEFVGAPQHGQNGADSSFNGLVSIGGGGSGTNSQGSGVTNDENGYAGGCGGGAGTSPARDGVGGAGLNGNRGGDAAFSHSLGDTLGCGGGGGAGGPGADVTQPLARGGNGGPGLSSSISGTLKWYAGGGGGGAVHVLGGEATGGIGGSGVGGNGCSGDGCGSGLPGVANTGSGSGGAKFTGGGTKGADGVVIVAYEGDPVFTGGIVTSAGGKTIHTFNSSDDLVPIV